MAYPSVPAAADAPDDDKDDEDGLDDEPDLLPSDSEGEVSYGVPREVPVPNNPVPKRSRG